VKVLIAIEYEEDVGGDAGFDVQWEVTPKVPISRAHLRGILLEALDFIAQHDEEEV